MKTKEEIIEKMVDVMPFRLSENLVPYIYEAMEIYAKQQVKDNVVLPAVSERYLLIEWLNGNPMIDGSIYFDSKEDCLTYWQELPKTDLFEITHTICRITNVC